MTETIRALEIKLNGIIDDEIEKETADCDVISDSVDGLLRLENYSKYVISLSEKEQRLRKIFTDSNKAGFRRLPKPVKIMLIAALVAILLAISVIAYTGVRYKITDHREYSNIWNRGTYIEDEGDFIVGYIPEGYSLNKTYPRIYALLKEYVSIYGDYLTICRTSFTNTDFNTEYERTKTISIDGIEYIFYGESNHGKGIVFQYSDFWYFVSGELNNDELLKIAQSIVASN